MPPTIRAHQLVLGCLLPTVIRSVRRSFHWSLHNRSLHNRSVQHRRSLQLSVGRYRSYSRSHYCHSHYCRSHYCRSLYLLSLSTAARSTANRSAIALPQIAHALHSRPSLARSTFARAHCHSHHRFTCLLPHALACDPVGSVAVGLWYMSFVIYIRVRT
jgi:hypothetical protein